MVLLECKRLTSSMRTKLLAGAILSQCGTCLAVEVQVDTKRTAYQQSICDFPNLSKKDCYHCKVKNSGDKAVDTGITKTAV